METWEYLVFVYLVIGLGLTVYFTVQDLRHGCFPDEAVLLVPLIPFGWPGALGLLVWNRWRLKRKLILNTDEFCRQLRRASKSIENFAQGYNKAKGRNEN